MKNKNTPNKKFKNKQKKISPKANKEKKEKYLAFSVKDNGCYCVSASGIQEISSCEKVVPVPLTKEWFRGIVNSKGALYSVVDFNMFVAGHSEARAKVENSHLLYIRHGNLQSALLVERVFGFRYFDDAQIKNKHPDIVIPDSISAYINGVFAEQDENYISVDIEKLIESEQFREIQ